MYPCTQICLTTIFSNKESLIVTITSELVVNMARAEEVIIKIKLKRQSNAQFPFVERQKKHLNKQLQKARMDMVSEERGGTSS